MRYCIIIVGKADFVNAGIGDNAMKQEKIQLVSQTDGLVLDILLTDTDKKRRGLVQIVHGMAEYKERYLPLMQYLAEHGYACVIHDHRGHGKSIREKEDLGYFYGTGGEALVEDTHQITRYMKERYENLPFILLGHSMGSLVVRNYIKKYDQEIDMLINSGAPCKNPAVSLGIWLAKAQRLFWGGRYRSRLMQTLAFGRFVMRFRGEESPYAWTCSDADVVREYDASQKCGFTFTLDGFLGLFELLKGAYAKKGMAGGQSRPSYIISGGGRRSLYWFQKKDGRGYGIFKKERIYPGDG